MGHNERIFVLWEFQKEKGKTKGQRQCIKAIMPENFLNLGREINIQLQVAQRIPNRFNLNRASQKHFIIKLSEVNKRILKTAKEKREKLHARDPS